MRRGIKVPTGWTMPSKRAPVRRACKKESRRGQMSALVSHRLAHLVPLLLSQMLVSACDSVLTTSKETQLHFEGAVAAPDGQPLAGATVDLQRVLFVFYGTVNTAVTDANGRYRLIHSLNCDPGEYLNQAPGNSHYLRASAPAYEPVSSINMGYQLRCVRNAQTADFLLLQRLPTITGYTWTPDPPFSGEAFSGTITGTGFYYGTELWFCENNANTCHQHPVQEVTFVATNRLTVANVTLSAGQWQVYVTYTHGASARAGPFTVL
jgi:hypothetical protein